MPETPMHPDQSKPETGWEAWTLDAEMIWIKAEDGNVVVRFDEIEMRLNSGHVEQLVNGLLGAVGGEAADAILNSRARRHGHRS